MLTIRPEQMRILEAHMMRRYEDRVMAKLGKIFPERFRPESESQTREFVQTGVRKAGRHGITEDDDVEAFVLLTAAHGLDFEQPPDRAECRTILGDKELPADVKVSLLRRELEASEGAGR